MNEKQKTARETLREWGFAEVPLAMMSDEECEAMLESVIMYPES